MIEIQIMLKCHRYNVIKMLGNEMKKRIKSCSLKYGKGAGRANSLQSEHPEFTSFSSDPIELLDRLNLLYQEKKLEMFPKL